jgi:peroxiredoxin
MSAPVALGQTLPDVPLEQAGGGETRLASLRGRPLVIVCVRYYG